MNLAYLESLRRAELETVLPILSMIKPAPCRILEIGAGSGWQAKGLADHGYEVMAIDLAGGDYTGSRAWPVTDYDGENIPFDDDMFDVVFSSNVLEHILEIETFQREIQRVLKPGAIALHLLPSAAWRLWTSLAHYAFIIKTAITFFAATGRPSDDIGKISTSQRIKRRTIMGVIIKVLFPHLHGERGNVVTEVWYFSRWWWTPLFTQTGWTVRSRMSNRLYYTGYGVLGLRLPMAWRRALSSLLGGACHLYILQNIKDQ